MIDPRHLPDEMLAFLAEPHYASLTMLRADGSPHSTAVAFTYDPSRTLVRILTFTAAVKARLATRGRRVSLCQIDGLRWLTLEGTSRLTDDPADIADAVEAYAGRYRRLGERADRQVIHVAVDRVLARIPAG